MRSVEKLNLNIKEKEIENQLKQIDNFGNGQLNYTEFLTATLSVQAVMTDEILWELFESFDIDKTAFISVDNLKDVFHGLGRIEITEEEIIETIAAHDITKNG